jgi:hypothetical protein
VITSTLLTLVVVPVIYSFVVRERKPQRTAPGVALPAQMPADRE